MEKYEKTLEKEVYEGGIKSLKDSLEKFFKNKFKITESGWEIYFKKRGKPITCLNFLDEEIHIISKKYERDLRSFRDFYENKIGVDFKLIF